MKINNPVTNHEVTYPENYTILSTTDLKGATTYANKDFLSVSGFVAEDLLGKNHNVVRHPDMPPAAFADLWATIQTGKQWIGIVKNRCKNGDFYWVDAYVTPIYENGKIVEYQSVRHIPERSRVDRAEKLYQLLNEKGKLPLALRLPQISYHNKLFLGTLFSFLPLWITATFTSHSGISLLAATGISIILAYLISLIHGKRIKKIAHLARQTIDNKLSQYIYTNTTDDIGQIQLALEINDSRVNAIVGRINDSCDHLNKISDHITETAKQTNTNVQRQLSETEQIVSAITEMAASIQEVAQNTHQAAAAADQVQAEVQEGQGVVNQTITTIEKLAANIKQATEVIQHLEERSSAIDAVLDVINNIAEQTNLLALNAAIEAARAGENGRGFAVVADEVRTLAQRTQQSTSEIQEMIERLQSESKNAVGAMASSQQFAEDSVVQATKAGATLASIIEKANTISIMNTQIAAAAVEQTAVASEIEDNIHKINDVAQESVRLAQDNFEINDEFGTEIRRQKTLVAQF